MVTGACGYQCIGIVAYEGPWIPMDGCWYLWIPMDRHRCLWRPIDTNGWLLVLVDRHWCLCRFIDICECQWISVGAYGGLWVSVDR